MIRAEWTKFRTVRGWVAAAAISLLLIVAFAVLPGAGGTCDDSCGLPIGPEGQEVTDEFQFVHQTLTGDGSITARITSWAGTRPSPDSMWGVMRTRTRGKPRTRTCR